MCVSSITLSPFLLCPCCASVSSAPLASTSFPPIVPIFAPYSRSLSSHPTFSPLSRSFSRSLVPFCHTLVPFLHSLLSIPRSLFSFFRSLLSFPSFLLWLPCFLSLSFSLSSLSVFLSSPVLPVAPLCPVAIAPVFHLSPCLLAMPLLNPALS